MHSPKMPAAPALPPPPPAAPTIDQAQLNVDNANQMRRRRGRAADLLAPVDSGALPTGAKALLG
jgi:hypothetical protein